MNAGRKLISKLRPRELRHTKAARAYHWILASSVVGLIYSGNNIAHPRPASGLDMRRSRLMHFSSQFLFLGSFFGRIIYGWRSGNYKDIIPVRKDFSALPSYMKYEFFLSKKEPQFPKYNPFQKIIFTAWLPLFIFQALTGAILYAPRRLAGGEAAIGGLGRVKKLHYLNNLLVGVTSLGHIYYAVTASKEKLKSIFTGYKAKGKK